MRMEISAAVCSHIGARRSHQQDNYYFNGTFMPLEAVDAGASCAYVCKDARQLYAVCDGMSGGAMGAEAAHAVVSRMDALAAHVGDRSVREGIDRFIRQANHDVCALTEGCEGGRAGTTLALLYVDGLNITSANIGDSRTYLLRDGRLQQLSTDQTEAQRMVRMGILTEEQARQHPTRHSLTCHLGIPEDHFLIEAVFSERMALRSDDVWMICSDGITDTLDEGDLSTLLSQPQTPEALCGSIIAAALNRQCRDNVTVLVLRPQGNRRKF